MTSENPESPSSPSVKKVVFVCEHGAAKSVLAGSYFNYLAHRHGLSVRAVARGTEPGEEVAERVRVDASNTGLELCAIQPTLLTDADVSSADMVVAFDVKPQLGSSKPQLAWDGLPLLSQDFDRGKALIIAQVEALVAALRERSDQDR